MSVSAQDDLVVRKVAIAGDVTRRAGERGLVVGLEPVLALAVEVDEAEQVGSQRGIGRDTGQVRTLHVFLQPNARELQQAELIGLVLGEPAQDVCELAARLEGSHDRRLVDPEDGCKRCRHALSLSDRHLIGRHKSRVDGRVDDELRHVAVKDHAPEGRQLDDLAVLGLGLRGQLDVADDLPIRKSSPHDAGEQHRRRKHREDS